MKLIRNKQKSQLKIGQHKEFIDRIWGRLHGPGGGIIENDFTCNTFYGAYCENMKYLFELETGETSISKPKVQR